jgi:ABC-type transport system involved in cytochrome c biogenesis permease subunit
MERLLDVELWLHWVATGLYFASAALFAERALSKKARGLGVALAVALAGFVVHTVAGGIRWYAVGHGPYVQRSESMSSVAWVGMVLFLAVCLRLPRLRGTGVVVLPACVLTLLAGLAPSEWLGVFIGQALEHGRMDIEVGLYGQKEIVGLPPTFHGTWFVVHVTSTIAAMAAILVSLGTALLYLGKERNGGAEFYERLPSLAIMDNYSSKFVGVGFVLWTVMIVTGAIWAEEVWGSYWQWDAIQIWSVMMWLVMGLYLHLRRFFKWQGARSALLLVGCVILSVLTLFAIPVLTDTPMFPGT